MSTQMLPREVLSDPGGGGCMTCRIGGGARDMSCEARALSSKGRGGVCEARSVACDGRDGNCEAECEIAVACEALSGPCDMRRGSYEGMASICEERVGPGDGRQGSCEGRHVSCDSRHASCNGSRGSCDGRSLDCTVRNIPCENRRVSYGGRGLPGGQHTERGGRIYRSWRGRGFSNRHRQRQPRLASQHLSAETRAAKSVAVIVLLFVISWIPLYILNTVVCFWPDAHVPPGLIKFGIVLSHFNSAWNPALYAWGMRDFKHCLRKLLGQFHKPRTLIAML